MSGKMQFSRNSGLFPTWNALKPEFPGSESGAGDEGRGWAFPHPKIRLKTGTCQIPRDWDWFWIYLNQSKDFSIIFPHSDGWFQKMGSGFIGRLCWVQEWIYCVDKCSFQGIFYYSQPGMGYKLNVQYLRVGLGINEAFPTSQTRLKTGRCNPNPKGLGLISVSLSKSKDSRIIFPDSDGCL